MNSLKDIVGDYVNPFASPVSLTELCAMESITSMEVYDVYTSIESDSTSIEFMLQSIDDDKSKSEEKFFSKETFDAVVKSIIAKLKLVFAKILVVISNFIKAIMNWFAGIAIKKQAEDYEKYKNKIMTGKFDDVIVKGIPIKNPKVFNNPENITNCLKNFGHAADKVLVTAKHCTDEMNKFFNDLDKTDSKEFFARALLGLTSVKILVIDYPNLSNYMSLGDPDVKLFFRNFDLERRDQINFILKGPKTVASLYVYGETAFENYKDVIEGISPVFSKMKNDDLTMKDFLKNTDYNEFNLLSLSSSVKVKQNVNLMKSAIKDITNRLTQSKCILENLEGCVDKLHENMRDGIIKNGFSKASEGIKTILGAVNESRMCNFYATGIFLSYYSMYLSHRAQLHAAMLKCVGNED